MTAELAAVLKRLRSDLVEEATPLPGQSRAYGRPHAHPRTRYEPRYSKTGERLAGVVKVRPDCPRPVNGRCECPPDGSWRPSVGVIRADSAASQLVAVPSERLRGGTWPAERIFVHSVYEQGPDGLWRCRWPVRRALEHIRGISVRRWAIAVRLLQGDPLMSVWGSHGAPPDPTGEAIRLLRQVERWAAEERETEWEVRPRQWWDAPRKPSEKSDAQANAETAVDSDAQNGPELEAAVAPDRAPASGAVRSSSRPARSGARSLSASPRPLDRTESACA